MAAGKKEKLKCVFCSQVIGKSDVFVGEVKVKRVDIQIEGFLCGECMDKIIDNFYEE